MVTVDAVSLRLPSPVAELYDNLLASHGVRLFLKRDDLIHPEIPGNKWRKLKYNIAAARSEAASTLLTFGGAYSNHIRATAAAGHYFGFKTIGVIRGEEHLPLNESLAYAVSRGMSLDYMPRSSYRQKKDFSMVDGLRRRFGEFYLIPEGGSNGAAAYGCAELVKEIEVDFDVICCPCGTGGTLAGISMGLGGERRALGFSVLKGGDFLVDEVTELQRVAAGRVFSNWSINTDFHFGGFARRKQELDSFISSFEQKHQITLDWVYVAKMMYGIFALVEQGVFTNGTVVVAVITG
jgi:1-aminocyclopropane-1-carboxylate deaminase